MYPAKFLIPNGGDPSGDPSLTPEDGSGSMTHYPEDGWHMVLRKQGLKLEILDVYGRQYSVASNCERDTSPAPSEVVMNN